MSQESATGETRWLDRIERIRARLEPLLPTLRALAFLAAVGIVVVMAVGAAGDVKLDGLTWWPLPPALGATVVWWLLLARGWAVLASGRFARADVATWCRTQALRYLPGGVWAPASRATVLHGRVLDRIATVAAENVIALCAALAIGGVSLGLSGAPLWLPLVLTLGIPALASRFVSDHTRLAPARTHSALVNYLGAFAGYAAAAVLVQGAVSGFAHPFEVAGAAALSWAVGLVVVIAPGGLGVRELAYVALLSQAFPDAELAAGAVTTRGLTIAAELGVLLMAGRPQALRDGTRRTLAACQALARRHALFLTLFTLGATLRVLSSLAYHPALIFYDSVDYIDRADQLKPGRIRPLGYSVFLGALPGDSLAAVPATQHLMGLAIALMLYALLVRLGVRRWVAALAAAPVLLDAYQLVLEQFALSETLFAFLLVAGCTALLWRPCPRILEAGLAGALFGGVALTRASGAIVLVLALAALAALYWQGRHTALASLRRAVAPAAALVVGFALPVGAYAVWFQHVHGDFAITSYGGPFLYGRVSTFVDCKNFSVPRAERVLCPREAVGHRPRLEGSTVNWYTWARYGKHRSPRFDLPDVPDRSSLPGRFARRAIRAQPWAYLRVVGHDFLRGFAPIRTRHDDELPISRWQFSAHYPVFSKQTPRILREHGDFPARSRPGLGRVLRDYQRFGFTWGPVLVLSTLAGALAAAGVGRARESGLRTAAFLFASMPLAIFGATVAINTFTWRYQIILAILLPPAGALGLTAVLGRRVWPQPVAEGERRYPAPGQPEPV